jgi:exosortase D (VPLPA-CTERM-specific)
LGKKILIVLGPTAVYIALLTGIYYSTYYWLISRDWFRDDYSASMLIPFVSLYLILEKRVALRHVPPLPSWVGMAVMLSGAMLFLIGELGGEYFSLYFSSWLFILGLCWLHLGWKKLKVIAFPIFLLLAMFPLPHFIHGKLSFKLKLISSQIGVKMMQWMGMSAYREGNVIDLGFTQLQVVDACNGLRYLIPLIILGLIIAYFFKTVWWKRLLLVASTIPIAVFVNSLRIASVGILYQSWGPKVAEGFFHDFSGWFIFMLTVGLLLALMGILRKVPPTTPNGFSKAVDIQKPKNEGPLKAQHRDGFGLSEASDANQIRAAQPAQSFVSPYFLTACSLLVITLSISMFMDFHEQVPISKRLSEFPSSVGGWHGEQRSMEEKFINELDLSDYLITDYRNGENRTVNLYVAYYGSQRKGESIHSPATCMPGAGWFFRQSGSAQVPVRLDERNALPVKRAYMQKGDFKQLSYFWFPMRGRFLTSAFEMKLYNFWDALTRQRTDGALVRVITPIYSDEALEHAEVRLKQFVGDMVPVLNEFLPQ